jgi:hypothetical protein
MPLAVNDNDWFDYARKTIFNSNENLEKAAGKLDTFLAVLWSVYTAMFALGTLFNFLNSSGWQLILLALPVLSMMIARYFCVEVSMPSLFYKSKGKTSGNGNDEFKPDDAKSIISSYKQVDARKRKNLKWANNFTLVSILFITAGLLLYNYFSCHILIKPHIQYIFSRRKAARKY